MTKIYTLTHILVLIFFSINLSFAQTVEAEWEEKYGTFFDDAANDIILNNEGGLTMIGETNPSGASGKDILFISLDKLHYVNYEKPIVLSGTDGANALVQTRDGGYAIAGYTTSKEVEQYHGKKDGLILKVTEKGRPLWYLAVGSKEDDELFDIIEDRDGNLVVSGHKNGACFVVKISAQGELLWQKIFPFSVGRSYANTLLQNLEGQYVLAGHVEEDKYTQTVFVMGLDDTPTRKWKEEYANGSIKQIIENKDGTLIFTGTTYEKETREDILLMKTYRTGGQIWRKNYGGSGYDGALGLTQDFDGNYFLGGYNSSFERGAKRDLAWVVKVNQDGQRMSDMDLLFGKNSQDEFRALVTDYDGSIIAAGASASGKKLLFDAWALKVPTDERVLPSGKVILRSSKTTFYDGNENGVLEPNERGYVAFTLKNNSDDAVEQLELEIASVGSKIRGLDVLEKIRINRIASGAEHQVYVPIYGDLKLKTGRTNFSVKVTSNVQDVSAEKLEFLIESAKEPEPEFVISEALFTQGDKPLKVGIRKEEITANFTVSNIGNRTAENVKVRMNTERYIIPVSKKIILLNDLKAGEKREVQFTFRVEGAFLGEQTLIKSNVGEKGYDFQKDREFLFSLEEISEPVEIVPPVKKEEPVVIVPPIEKPVVIVPVERNFISLDWLSPNPDELENNEDRTEVSSYELKVKAKSNLPLSKEQFTIFVDGKEFGENAKFDEVKLRPGRTDTDGRGKIYSYTFITNIELSVGKHEITIKAKNDKTEKMTESVFVNYTQERPNLFVLSIGAFDNGQLLSRRLKYTEKDAADIAEAYRNQQGTVFESVNVELLNDSLSTTKVRIRKALDGLLNQFDNGTIQSKDVVIIYISTHGFSKQYSNGSSDFYLQPSNQSFFDDEKTLTALNYDTEVLAPLDKIGCKKFLFIDACKSGTVSTYEAKYSRYIKSSVDEDIAEAVALLNSDTKSIRTIASCSEAEYSYEHPSWNNSAFAKGILEAFKDASSEVKDGKVQANIDKDNSLSISELYDFIKKRIPHIVNKEMPEEKGQNPYMDIKYQYDDVPIYFYKK